MSESVFIAKYTIYNMDHIRTVFIAVIKDITLEYSTNHGYHLDDNGSSYYKKPDRD